MKKIISLMIIAVFILAVSLPISAQTIVLRYAHFAPPEQPIEIAGREMGDRIAERTDGAFELRTFPASQLGGPQEMIQLNIEGSINLTTHSASGLGEVYSAFSIVDAPFVFESIDHAREFFRSDLFQDIARGLLEERGLRILDASGMFGARHLSTRNTPVREPEDLQGLRIRVHEAESRADMIRAWGAEPVITPTEEMYMAMQTGLADGQESPFSWQRDNKYWEVQNYIMHTGHFIQNEVLAINEEFFQSLSPEHQQIILEEAIIWADEVTRMYEEANAAAVGTLQEMGMTYIDDVNIAAFQDATVEMWEKWEETWGEGLQFKVVNREYNVLSPEEWQDY